MKKAIVKEGIDIHGDICYIIYRLDEQENVDGYSTITCEDGCKHLIMQDCLMHCLGLKGYTSVFEGF